MEKTSAHKPLVVKMINYLNCHLVKVDHHGSMHSAPLDIYEIMTPKKAVISTLQKTSENKTKGLEREMFPAPPRRSPSRSPEQRSSPRREAMIS